MSSGEKWKLGIVLVALAAGMAGLARFFLSNTSGRGESYFYDLGEKKLFTADHEAVPPIQGKFGTEMDGVRAVVVSMSGDCQDKSSLKIVYLETYAAEFKQMVDEQKAKGPEAAPAVSRSQVQAMRLIKRPEEANWHQINSPQAQQIMETLIQPGPNGAPPAICLP